VLSRSSIYALQAALHLARKEEGVSVSAARLAEELGLPREYLAKVLRRLSREGVLVSSRGVYGGYRLAMSREEMTVERVVRSFEEVDPPRICLLGGHCHTDEPCSAHLRRLEWNEARKRILAATTLDDLLTEPAVGRQTAFVSTDF
jgi:Rrf2 family protein